MERTSKFRVTYTDSEQHLTKVEVVEVGTNRFNELALRAMSPEDENIVGTYVPDDTPVGLVGKAKQLHYREKGRYIDKQINYEVKDGIISFLDFLPFDIYGYKIDRHKTDAGDILKVIIKSPEIIPLDKSKIRNLTYLLKRVQAFNDGLLDESLAEANSDFLEEDNEESEEDASSKDNRADSIGGSFEQIQKLNNTGVFDR
ncbi:hypothetical protein [Ligilactobacillus murinus]|uniref:Uncharacterized protein n=1 Tax=Ligilactobacillus murinus TaxID=1622 RepID=A0AAE6WJE6_9LACO|nr:hypothetical protein [Ligilactobacillus murinus]NEF82863.1 hypothetical protein [Ligilactobacillus murinus]NEF84330.1 hypothetical protein [Ligilactobacillus murinus]NEF87461.1 hypothetical protein [Ligilactobacillus murinus]NEF89741.1 hypothetical protein [Ligilactobacillus murinus]NEF92022.1 hypothetical protein [Ligilactobacillus murinus]